MTGGMSGMGGTAGTGGMTGGGGTAGTAPTGGGGTGGKPECMAPNDCGISDACKTYACEGGMCKDVLTQAGTKIPAQVIGDCKTNICDGNGGIVNSEDSTDFSDDQNDCTDDTCVAGAPVNDAKAKGAACMSGGGKLCDGAKKCVECLANADCMTGACAADHTCAPATCADMLKNGAETDIDCGGPVCGKCPVGKACVLGSDCMEGVCDPGLLVCAAQTCMDLIKNGTETDVDCGGPTCPDCIDGKTCLTGTDCLGGFCIGPPVCQSALNGCTLATAIDHTADDVTVVTQMGLTYTPSCIKIKAGKQVTVNAAFAAHPLSQGGVVNGTAYPEMGGPITHTASGSSATFTFPNPGQFGYYCDLHYSGGMYGAVIVVP
jgi:plastocyanin